MAAHARSAHLPTAGQPFACHLLLHTDDAVILIDCGPDFRTQMLRASVYERIDGVLITHEHYDHVGGLDDLRPFCRFSEIPVYSDAYTAAHLRARMPYCFVDKKYPGVPRIYLQEVEAGRLSTCEKRKYCRLS